jgi:hypothetical protein
VEVVVGVEEDSTALEVVCQVEEDLEELLKGSREVSPFNDNNQRTITAHPSPRMMAMLWEISTRMTIPSKIISWMLIYNGCER